MRRPSALTVFIAVVALAVGAKVLVVEPFRVAEGSMAPTYAAGEHIIVNKLAYRVRGAARGEVAVLRAPRSGELLLKRIVGLEGDVVEIRDGTLFVNGRRHDESFVVRRDVDGVYFGPARVPRDAVFVLGDNRGDSLDSRTFGPVSEEALVGRVDLRAWPL